MVALDVRGHRYDEGITLWREGCCTGRSTVVETAIREKSRNSSARIPRAGKPVAPLYHRAMARRRGVQTGGPALDPSPCGTSRARGALRAPRKLLGGAIRTVAIVRKATGAGCDTPDKAAKAPRSSAPWFHGVSAGVLGRGLRANEAPGRLPPR